MSNSTSNDRYEDRDRLIDLAAFVVVALMLGWAASVCAANLHDAIRWVPDLNVSEGISLYLLLHIIGNALRPKRHR